MSLMTNTFHDTSSNFDDLTAAIADLSRIPSPDPVAAVICCCGKENCDSFRSWLVLKEKLGQRLVLSAGVLLYSFRTIKDVEQSKEVGQALLQRHEAYVRNNERKLQDESDQSTGHDEVNRLQLANEGLQRECDVLLQEKDHLEKRLNQALVNSEVTEVSSKTILQELQEAKETISRLTVHHARSIGWETRLAAAKRERDDMQQERDCEMHRARLAESRFAVLKDKTAKLQAEVRRLQENLEEKRLHRLESSELLIRDARTRLESFRNLQLGFTAKVAEDELTNVLDAMVHDNEVLKHDNAELQHLLTESREEMHSLQEELEEQRANPPLRISRSGGNTPNSRHHHTGSVPTIGLKEFMLLSPPGRPNSSAEGNIKRRTVPPSISLRLSPAPTTPDTNRSPTDADSLAPSESKWASFGQLSPGLSHLSTGPDENAEQESTPTHYEKPRGHKPLLLLARSRGVQTESGHTQSVSPSHLSSNSPHDPRSETSSFSESQPSHLSSILERIVALFNRIAQADALTLTNRLKRQHLKGADVGHLSRSTVASILADVTGLRTQFRFLLEDEKTVTSCSRKELRLFFKVVKDVFTELGQLRVAMNDVILDPSSAVRLSELALNPSKDDGDDGRETGGHGGAAAWMAPLSKLFLPSAVAKSDSGGSSDRVAPSYGSRIGGLNASRPPKFVPKLGPALAASATTVNVEFSGTGVGRAVTSTVRLHPTTSISDTASSMTDSSSSALMGIFAGAQKTIEPADHWVVLPSVPRKKPATSLMVNDESSIAAGISTVGRSTLRRPTNRLSRNVDAVIDIVDRPRELDDQGEEQDYVPPLMQRTLRRRGLSDSSIRSTFTNQAGEQGLDMPPSPKKNASPASRMPVWRDPNAVFQAFRWGMFSFGQPVPSTDSDADAKRSTSSTQSQRGNGPAVVTLPSEDVPEISAAPVGHGRAPSLTAASKIAQPKPVRVASPNRGGVLPNLTSWAASSILIDSGSGSDPFIASSLRDETYLQRAMRRSGSKDETHIRDFY